MQSLNILLLPNARVLQIVGRQIAFGIYELLKIFTAYNHIEEDRTLIFLILEYVGARIVSKNNNIGILFKLKKIILIKILLCNIM